MNTNPAPTSIGLIAWDGAASFPRDIRNHNHFGFVAEVTTTLTVDTVFEVNGHIVSAGDSCVADAALQDIPEVLTCANQINGTALATESQITIPSGTPAGTLVMFAMPCKTHAFVSLQAISGDTPNVSAVMVLHGPKF